jgi:hypothetical protein
MRCLRHQLGFGCQRVLPEHMHRIAAGRLVGRHIILQYPERDKALVQLEIYHGIAKLLVDHGGQIIDRIGIFALAPGIAGQAPAKDNALQPEMLAQFTSHLVEAQADPQPPVIRVDADFHAIENFAIWVMPRSKAATGYFRPAMRRAGGFLRDLEGRAMADNLAFIFRDQLAIGEIVDLAAHFLGCIAFALAVNLARQGGDLAGVFQFRHADDELRFFCGHPGPLAVFWAVGNNCYATQGLSAVGGPASESLYRPAVDLDCGAGHIARRIRSQKDREIGDFFRLPDPLHRNLRSHSCSNFCDALARFRRLFRKNFGNAIGLGEPGTDRINQHIVRCDLVCERLGPAQYGHTNTVGQSKPWNGLLHAG